VRARRDSPSGWVAAARRHWYEDVLERAPSRVYCAHVRRRNPYAHVVTRDYQLLIEGDRSSGNSFARDAFLAANPGVAVGSHIHSPAHVAEALRLRIPTILLVRSPEDAVTSRAARWPEEEVGTALRRWLRFYSATFECRDRVVVASFEQLVADFGAVIERVNAAFGSTFVPFEHTAANVESVFRVIDNSQTLAYGAVDGRWVARPSDERVDANREARRRLQAPELRRLLARCNDLYGRYVATARTLG